MDNSYAAKKYFIYGFKKFIENDNKILSREFLTSIRNLFDEYIQIYTDINKDMMLE